MRSVRRPLALALAALLGLAACARAQRPALYPNAHLERVGQAQAERDEEDCRRLADKHVESVAAKEVGRGAAIGAAGGAAVGAVGGAVSGRGAGTGAAIGAATGATAGAVSGAARQTRPSPVYKEFVNRCLRERGYVVIGWQ